MSPPEAILDEIRAARVPASAELRERVLALAVAPPAPPRRRLPWRRTALVLVPACAVLAVAGALAAGLVSSSSNQGQSPGVPLQAKAPDRAQRLAPQAAVHGSVATLPATPGRAQDYAAQLTLRVRDLSAATKRALRLTRSFRGYVRSVDYGSGSDRGTATLVLRVPVGRIQAAIVRFSALGTILDQHVSIVDVQPQLDARFRALQALRATIAKLQTELASTSLSTADRQALERKLAAARGRLVSLQRVQAQQERQASFATVGLDLRTASAAVVSHHPGRIGRALHRSGGILLDELKVLVYVLVVAAPLLVLAALAVVAARLWRRRTEARLLSTS